jgi:hypothetical protein
MESLAPIAAESLLGRLREVPDPRRRQGRRYPLSAVLGMLVLAALHGETSLRGMYLWAQARWPQVWEALGFWTPDPPPQLTTVWKLLVRLDPVAFERVLGEWVESVQGPTSRQVSIDGKALRGSRRRGQRALHVVEAVGQDLAGVLRQHACAEGEELAAALVLLRAMPVAGRLVTMDAGLFQRAVAQTIVERDGAYLGVLKGNQPEVKGAVDEWVAPHVSPPGERAAARLPRSAQRPRAARTAGVVGGGR